MRADFPIFEHLSHGKPLAFLDSAASAQKPRQVLDAMTTFYETSYANVHRSVYELAEKATEALESSRETVRAFLNAPSEREVIFVRNATEGINLVAYAWGLSNLGPGDVVVSTELEHHSNYVPWQYIASRTGASFKLVPLGEDNELDLSKLDEIAAEGNVKVLAIGLVSNALGTVNPVDKLVAWAHGQGAIVVADGAQAAPHRAVDVQELGHRFRRDLRRTSSAVPSGIGALVGQGRAAREDGAVPDRRAHDRLGLRPSGRAGARCPQSSRPAPRRWPRRSGLPLRSTTSRPSVSRRSNGTSTSSPPTRSTGSPSSTGCAATGHRPTGGRASSRSTSTASTPTTSRRCSTSKGIAIRAGHHCAQPLMKHLGVPATNRASFYLYSTMDEVDRLVDGLHVVKEKLT